MLFQKNIFNKKFQKPKILDKTFKTWMTESDFMEKEKGKGLASGKSQRWLILSLNDAQAEDQ